MRPTSFILVPLYIYPTLTPSPPAWSFLYTAVHSYPHINFKIIINPDSGPGLNPFPDSNYVTSISNLNSFPNVQLLGYVYTLYGQRPIHQIERDILVYAGWSNLSVRSPSMSSKAKLDIRVSGIFFDQINATQANFGYMSTVTEYAKTALTPSLGGLRPFIVLNPGISPFPLFYNISDAIVVYEESYQVNLSNQIAKLTLTKEQKLESVVMIHGFIGNEMAQKTLVYTIINAGIGGLFVTNKSGYDSPSGLWSEFCTQVDAK